MRRMLTQDQLAARSGVSVRTIRNLEGGRVARPHPDSVRSLADALGLVGPERDALAAAVRSDVPAVPTVPAVPVLVPRQLPAPPRWFAGRADEFAELDDALSAAADSVMVATIGGAGGVGKTALALRWAHRNADRFPDGQLFLNLRGFDPSNTPLSPSLALRTLLDALGADQGPIPSDLDGQAGLYRSLLAGRRMLIVLDNARDSDQVTPLLPGSPTCAALVTSRHHLSALVATHGARPVRLDVLGAAEAAQLLRDRLGAARCDREPEAVTALLRRCAGLPLALHIVAARAAVRTLPLTALARELDEVSSGLDALDAGEIGVDLRAVFDTSYRVLDAEAAGLFDLLGLVPGPDIGLAAIAAMLDRPVAQARRLVRELDNAHLISQQGDGRYGTHDLVRRYAAERAGGDPTPRALLRLVAYYAWVAHVASSRQQNLPIDDEDRPADEFEIPPLEDIADCLAWLDAEQANLLATLRLALDRDWAGPAWRLAVALDGYYYWRGRMAEHLAVWRLGLAIAERLSDPVRLAIAHRGLGIASGRAGLLDDSLDHLRRALGLAERSGDPRIQARVHRSLAWVYGRQRDLAHAVRHGEFAVRLYESIGDMVALAGALNAAGWYAAQNGQFGQARERCESALELAQKYERHEIEAGILDSLGYIAHHTGAERDALRRYQEALVVYRQLGTTYGEADTLNRLGEVHAALGEPTAAREAWSRAIDLYQAQHRAADANKLRQRMHAANNG